MVALQNKSLGHRLAKTAFISGIVGIPLWALSYVWIPFRLMGQETEAVWSFVVISEIMAEVVGIIAIAAGLIAKRSVEPGSVALHQATRGIILGVVVCICVIVFNAIGILFF
ncbi:hypothetical protein GCM10023189_31510 [Nibrella saemangeumensis]|uniref:Uncharacterized protein n=1 Tax=Nibrella saemangeumensis TaxID=1084526 RepID=A0ABP8MZN7_9BACT